MHITSTILAMVAYCNCQDTIVVKNDTIQEIVVTAQSPRQRVEAIQVGAEQLQLNELGSTPP